MSRRVLAAVVVAAAVPLSAPAHASAGSCLDPLTAASLPPTHVVHVEPDAVWIDPHGADELVDALWNGTTGVASCVLGPRPSAGYCVEQFGTTSSQLHFVDYDPERGYRIDVAAIQSFAGQWSGKTVALAFCLA